jgi:hypothetical protein
MRTLTGLLLVLLNIAPFAHAGELRVELARLAKRAHARIIMDRSVRGPIPPVTDFDWGNADPLLALRTLAQAAGYTVTEAHPASGGLLLVVAGEGRGGSCGNVVGFQPAHVQVDAMVVSVHPGILRELAAVGNELPPLPGSADIGHQFLDGIGPGLKVLSFDRVEPRLHEHLPWGEVGLSQPGAFLIRSRQKVTVAPGGCVQIPLEAAWFQPGPASASPEALVKQALVVTPRLCAPGRVHLVCRLRKAVTLPLSVDASAATGGVVGTSAEIPDGGEMLVTGLGPAPPIAPPVVVEEVDPLERYRPHRLLHHHRHDDCPPPPPPMDIAVLMVARLAPLNPY